ncbi:hypothetical protein FA10DRAFT_268522 [Acaromyces ingoldii]|uniref:Uncharacterized protein n=1 Tax=Acaromyces ingoldii TaxID=215250 RepID=A0A316YGR2_9BASI|nr:hypothetical protein FA10DRAFT_268522 [Acaromyces ingoldii]PWN88321.1 hypothetical protein FA10DRAFT_268522 [Acaromyces ingoldii]
MASPEGRTRQRLLNVAIERLKDGSDCYDPSSSLYDVGNKLEKLLSACAKRRKVVEADPSKGVCTFSSSPLTPPDALAFTTAGKQSQGGADLFSLDQLDSQLLRFGGRSQVPHPPSVSNNKKGQEPSASLASASAGGRGTFGDNTGIGDLSMLSDVALQQQLNDSSYTPPSSLDMPMPASWEDPFASDQDGVMDWEKVWADIFSTVDMAR